jgi:hypothetical protein
MTGDVSMSRSSGHDVATFLDALDQAHAAAMTGEWFATRNRVFAQRTGFEPLISACERRADAAAIVAEHNALPALTSALRAVLALADDWDTDDDARYSRNRIARSTAARAVRDAVRSALGVETTEAGQ